MEDTLYSEGYFILLSSINNNVMFESNSLKNLLAQKKINGLILEPTKSAYQSPNIKYLNNMISRNIPLVTINSSFPQINAPSLKIDDFEGGKLATSYLINLGHKNIMGIFKVDDSNLSSIVQPALTSITHPKEQMGRDAANLITKLINNNNNFEDSDSILYKPNLVIRNSTAEVK
ncbi:MAG: substrate-binding domain-containing protein [Clostridium sp.]|nr:substrate-binding domain-containing protein [Clostridium sp.]